jgi:XTP/dITP diphosphohydrolase
MDILLRKIVLSTRNQGKLREFRRLLQKHGSEVIDLGAAGIARDPEESGSTFAENARLKALACSNDTSLPVLADDSGLEVFSLDRRPGIHSARYAGDRATDLDRIRKLLAELEESGGSREARFVCALALAHKGRLLAEVEGECRGVIAREPHGAGGFGYDPIFFQPDLGCTFGELSAGEKDLRSHRARAVEALFNRVRC